MAIISKKSKGKNQMENLRKIEKLVEKIFDLYDQVNEQFRVEFDYLRRPPYGIQVTLLTKEIRFNCASKDPMVGRITESFKEKLNKRKIDYKIVFLFTDNQYRFNPETNKALNTFRKRGILGGKTLKKVYGVLKHYYKDSDDLAIRTLIIANREMNGCFFFKPNFPNRYYEFASAIKPETMKKWRIEFDKILKEQLTDGKGVTSK